MRKWLSRLTFSFLIIAAACGFEAFEGFQGRRVDRPMWLTIGLTIAAVVGFACFLAALRVRHHPGPD